MMKVSRNDRRGERFMKLEEQVVSLELAKKLKELGFAQDSHFYWHNMHGYSELEDFKANNYEDKKKHGELFYSCLSAYTTTELGKMLPDIIQTEPNELVGTGTTYLTIQHVGAYWEVGYTLSRGDMPFDSVEDKSEADARAKMLIYLKESNLT